MILDWSTCPAVERDPRRVIGGWVFCGTRIPVSALFENLEDGVEITELVDLFPGVTLEQVGAVLDHAAKSPTSLWSDPIKVEHCPTPQPLDEMIRSYGTYLESWIQLVSATVSDVVVPKNTSCGVR